jgi:hypothetical protein
MTLSLMLIGCLDRPEEEHEPREVFNLSDISDGSDSDSGKAYSPRKRASSCTDESHNNSGNGSSTESDEEYDEVENEDCEEEAEEIVDDNEDAYDEDDADEDEEREDVFGKVVHTAAANRERSWPIKHFVSNCFLIES